MKNNVQFEYYEKRWGKPEHLKNIEEKRNKEEKKVRQRNSRIKFIGIPVYILRFIVQLFITGPDRKWQNPLAVISMGLFLWLFNAYLIFHLFLIEGFVGIFLTKGSGIYEVTLGCTALFLILQCLRAVFIIGGWNQVYISKYARPFKGGYQYVAELSNDSQSSSSGNHSNDEFTKVNRLMNQHMAQLTNSQKINYLKDFYGDKN